MVDIIIMLGTVQNVRILSSKSLFQIYIMNYLEPLILAALLATYQFPKAGMITLPTREAKNRELYTDIYNGQHFDDLVFSIDEVVRRNALLVLYRPDNVTLLEELGVTRRASFPGDHQVIYMRHDVETCRLNTWYEYTAQHDIAARLGLTEFPALVWIPEGQPPDTIRSWPKWALGSGVTWREWLQKRLLHTVVIANKYDNTVVLTWVSRTDPQGSEPHKETVGGTSITSVQMLLYSIVTVCDADTGEFLRGFEVNVDTEIVTISAYNKANGTEEEWIQNTNNSVKMLHTQALHLRSAHALRHILMVKQPLFVPNITKRGYIVTKTPERVHRRLLEFYEKKVMGREDIGLYFTAWNQDEVPVSHAPLSEEETKEITDVLHPIVEEWCSYRLKPTSGPGIMTRVREYQNGMRIRMHVDELLTGHIIGTIMQVTRDLDGAEDWPLELVGYDGTTERVYTKPGDMVIFEASKVIHGRPTVFHGKVYVNSFVYFRPVEGFQFTAHGMDITHEGEVLSITPFTSMPSRHNVSVSRRQHDEL